jgi:glutamine amidotransferase
VKVGAEVIAIVNYGMGNLASINNMLKKIGAKSEITSDPARIRSAQKLILPGVGAFDTGMKRLADLGLTDVLNEQVKQQGVPVLGICLGMQLMTIGSEEGALSGLSWIDADTRRFQPLEGSAFKVPHMGWNVVRPEKPSVLLRDSIGEQRFYFVHSYYVCCRNRADVLLTSDFGGAFDAGFERENIMGVQFHPEKSHRFGMLLLRNFAGIA